MIREERRPVHDGGVIEARYRERLIKRGGRDVGGTHVRL